MQRFFRVIGRYRPGPRRVSLAAVETRLFQRRLQQIMEHQATVVGEVTEVNKGGILVDIDGMNAFCPSAQIAVVRLCSWEFMAKSRWVMPFGHVSTASKTYTLNLVFATETKPAATAGG